MTVLKKLIGFVVFLPSTAVLTFALGICVWVTINWLETGNLA